MARSKRGGYRKPSSPAAVSGPGALSQRTDGGPSAASYETSGLPYGDNKAVNDQQAAAPMSRGSGGGSGGGRPAPARPGQGVFGPTSRPNEPLTAGVDFGPGAGAPPRPLLGEDPNVLLRALASASGHPDLVRLVLGRGEGHPYA